MMRSQRGPLANTPFVSFPVDRTSRFDPGPFRALLLRRRRLFPFSCLFAAFGMAVYSTPLATTVQLAQQRVCWGAEVGRWSQSQHGCGREGGARFRANVFVRDMDLAEHNRLDNRRLEVVADGLPLFGGVQFAMDTTMAFCSPP